MNTSPDNKTIAWIFFEKGFNSGDAGIIDELVAPDARIIDAFPPDEKGPEGMKFRIDTYRRAFPDLRVIMEDTVSESDKVAVRWSARGTHRGELSGIVPTGRLVRFSGITILEVQEGRIRQIWSVVDTLGILQQIGAFPSKKFAARETVGVP